MQAIDSSLRRGFAWVLAFAVLAAVAAVGGGWGTQSMAASEAGVVQPAAQPVTQPVTQPIAPTLLPDYQIEGGVGARRETIERPAFVPTRRPAPTPVADVPKPRMPKGQFTLTGTAIVDQKHIAFLRETAGGKSRSVRAGETINGVVVAEVKADRVKLALGDESEELVLKVATGPRQTIQPPQPGQPGAAPVPGAPVPRPPIPGQPIAADTGAPMDSDATILERRRAARAALQAQQEAARAGGQPVPQTAPAPGALAIPQPAAAQPAAAPPKPDPAWNEVYRRMQQPRR